MNPRIAKEIRVQLPVFAFITATAVAMETVHLAQSPLIIINEWNTLTGVYFIGCIVMAAMVFGNEFHHRTLSLLVSQPMARKRIWREKMLVLGAFSAVSFIAVVATMFLMQRTVYIRGPGMPDEELFFLCFLLIVPILFSCTVPYLTLLSKSTIGGVVFAVFGAGMVALAGDMLWNHLTFLGIDVRSDKLVFGAIGRGEFFCAILFVLYAAILHWLGYRKFLRMEMIDSRALEASLPAALEAPFEGILGRFSGPFAKLLFKELRLQGISFALAAAFVAFIAFAALAWKFKTITNQFYFDGGIILYLFLFPGLVGVIAVAEENALGLKDWHATLPPSLNRQWRIKCAAALAVSLGLGATLIYCVLAATPGKHELSFGFPWLVLYCSLATATAMFTASLSTSSLKMFLTSLGLLVAFALGLQVESKNLTNPGDDLIGVIVSQMHGIYVEALTVLWNIIVCPVWYLTHSVEKTQPVAMWADQSANNHLAILLLAICAGGYFFFVLRLARTNYRHSDLVKGRVWKQFLLVVLAGLFLGIALLYPDHRNALFSSPRWTLLPSQPN